MTKIFNNLFNRNQVVKILKDNDWVLSLYNNYYLLKNRIRFDREVAKRRNLSLFEYEKLAEDLPYCPYERIKDTNFYGQAYSLKRYSGCSKFNYAIEHGLYYDNYVPIASNLSTVKRILTFSEIRKNVIERSTGKQVLTIGPYIHYAQPLLDDFSKEEIKRKYGKILLFFPTHSCANEGEIFDVSQTISQILKIKNEGNFDNVFVNMYYYDILHSSYASEYEKAGFKIVTAGHQLDLYFLSRLRTIIELSDYTISNNVGTHLGYCVYLNKPHYIFDLSIAENSKYQQIREIGKEFYIKEPTISQQQLNIVSKYWGFDCIKSPEELNKIFNRL